jgi:hypothetical protein
MSPPRLALARPAAAPAAVFAIVLTGCGGSGSSSIATKPPEQVVAAARAAARGAATVHVWGSTIGASKPISLNMELVAGKGAKGHVSVEGLGIDLVALERALYLNGSAAFYSRVAGPVAAARLHGRWLKAPSGSGNFASFWELSDLRRLTDGTLARHGHLAAAGTASVQGRPAVAVRDVSTGATLYVAATGTPYPLEIADAGGSGRITFDRWNQPVTLEAPPRAMNITQLENGH